MTHRSPEVALTRDLADRLAAAVESAEADARRRHDDGTCHLSKWSCSYCEVTL